MAITSVNEKNVKKTKFTIIYILITSIVLLSSLKFIPISKINNQQLLNEIHFLEDVLETQKNTLTPFKETKQKIDELSLEVTQIQTIDKIKRDIKNIESIYKIHDFHFRYNFARQISDLLGIYLNTKEKDNVIIKNIKTLKTNLDKCQANL